MGRLRLGVIADDLTGAADCGVQFASYGLSTLVQLDPFDGAPQEAAIADVLVINTGSRLGSAAAAELSTAAAIRALERAGCDRFFLKVDSALRGYVGECVRSALTALPGRVALVAPAYPKQGRVTRGGTQFSHGVPVAAADAGRDSVSPARQSHLPSLLRAAGVVTEEAASVAIVEATAGAVAEEAAVDERRRYESCAPAVEAVVFDATDDASFERPVRTAMQLQNRYVFVGAAGLARAVAAELAGEAGTTDHGGRAGPGAVTSAQRVGVLTVSGSLKEISRRQIAFAGAVGAHVVQVAAAQLVASGGTEAVVEEAAYHLRRAEHVIIAVKDASEDSAPTTEQNREDVKLAAALGAVAARTVRAAGVHHLILNGGDTALAVCRHLGVRGLWLVGEVLDGVPCATPLPPTPDAMRILSKSGGFGSDDTLHRAAQWLVRGAEGKTSHA